jgi:Restriction endonuclease
LLGMRFPFLIAVLLFASITASGQQLGQTKEAIIARNGPAIEENCAKNTAVYRSGPWKFDVGYVDGIAKKLTVTKTDSLTDDEIHSVLANNADEAVWREIILSGETRMWQRSDLATAQCDRIKPRSISMSAPPLRPRSTAAAPAPTIGSNALGTTSIAPSSAARNISLRRSSQDRPLPATSRVAPSVLGDAPEGLVALLFVVCFGALLLKLIPPLLLARGRRIAAGSVKKGPPTSTLPMTNRRPLPRKASPALALTLEDISWENFELLSGEIFRRQGFEVEISSGLGADGGKDLTLRREGDVRLVQCKRLSANNWVSVMEMREFYGLLVAENAKCGIFMTTGFYSQGAREFADGKPIKLLGRAEIEQLMASVTHPGENLCLIRHWIDDFAAGARVTDPNCPRCRRPMKLRRGATGRPFWGCSLFPRCAGKRDARTELVRAYSYQQS